MSSVTYCPEDNKLRLYVGRVPTADYKRLRAAGFVATPKQACNFVAVWTPSREDLAREFLDDDDDIGDEDYSPEERAADRAERFSGYRDKRATEAGASADVFDAGPSAFGHQSQARAERQAARHDRHRTYAVSQWSKAEYWQRRTKDVISHALHKSSPSVRRGRILTLEAEQRKHLKSIEERQTRYDGWKAVATMAGADELLPLNEEGYVIRSQLNPAQVIAFALANNGHCWVRLGHPTSEEANEESRRIHSTFGGGFSASDFLTRSDYIGKPFERFTPKQFAELYLAEVAPPAAPGSHCRRWADRYELRLSYENAMLENEGGKASDADMIPGGFVGGYQIQKVNKSPATGRVVSVMILAPTRSNYDRNGKPYNEQNPRPLCLRRVNIERLSEGAYRAPTPEELETFTQATKEAKKAEKASKPKPPPTINPTDEDAEKLQAIWNAAAKASHDRAQMERYGKIYTEYQPSEIRRMTQAAYSQQSKGSSPSATILAITERLNDEYHGRGGRMEVFKVRRSYPGGLSYAACRVVVLADKPRQPIPWDAVDKAKAKQPTADSLFHRLDRIAELSRLDWHSRDKMSDDDKRLLSDAGYVGWWWCSSSSQYGLTDEGREAFTRYQQVVAEGGLPVESGTMFPLRRTESGSLVADAISCDLAKS